MLTQPVHDVPRTNVDDARRYTATQALLEDLFTHLDQADIPWCVLRNRDKIPQGLGTWSDVDLILSSRMTTTALVRTVEDLRPVQIGPAGDDYASLFFPVEGMFLSVDILFGDMSWHGAPFAFNHEILSSRRDDRGIMVASPLYQAYTSWCSGLLFTGHLPQRYQPLVARQTHESTAEFRSLLVRTFGARLTDKLMALSLSGRLRESGALASRCRRAIWLRAWQQAPYRMANRFIRHVAEAVDHRVHPSGIGVALLGVDRAREKALCEAIADLPSRQIPFLRIRIQGLNHPMSDTTPAAVLTRESSRTLKRIDAAITGYLGGRLSSLPAWVALQTYTTIGLWLEELIQSRPHKAKGELILHYHHPIADTIEPMRRGSVGPMWLSRVFAHLATKPDLLLFLYGGSALLDQQLAGNRLVHLPGVDSTLTECWGEIRAVNNSQSLDDVLDDVLAEIALYTEERTKRRLFHDTSVQPFHDPVTSDV